MIIAGRQKGKIFDQLQATAATIRFATDWRIRGIGSCSVAAAARTDSAASS